MDTLDNDTVDVVFDNLGFQTNGNCRERSSSPSGIMQIVTLAVRNFCECTVFPRITESWASGWVSLADFSGFIGKVSTRQKLK